MQLFNNLLLLVNFQIDVFEGFQQQTCGASGLRTKVKTFYFVSHIGHPEVFLYCLVSLKPCKITMQGNAMRAVTNGTRFHINAGLIKGAAFQ